ncbi:MAG: O-antigen ligase family protein [Gaiellaceae bacterium]
MVERLRILGPADHPEPGATRLTGVWSAASRWRSQLLTLAVGASVFILSFRDGTFDVTSRAAFAIAVWWVVVLVLVVGFGSAASVPAAALVAAAGLAGLAALAGMSMAWSPSAERAFLALGLDLLYLGVFLLVALLARNRSLEQWCDGIALGIAAVACAALLSRLFPHLLGSNVQFQFLPVAQTRLSYPVGYWNGLAVLLALAFPLLLRIATCSPRLAVRGLAVVPFPVFGTVLYLTSSRGGVLAAAIAIVLFLVLTPRRVASCVALAVGAAGAVVAALTLSSRSQLVNGPLGAAATAQGRSAFYVILVLALGVGLVHAVVSIPLARTFGRAVEGGALAVVLAVAAAGVVAAHPVTRFRELKQPVSISGASGNYVTEHLLSSSSNGRWEMWTTAYHEFLGHPLLGDGAGSFLFWWEQHRPIPLFVQNAHSLYVETLAELGLVGLGLVALVVLTGLAVGIVRVLRADRALGGSLAALCASFAAFAFGAGVDWLWQIPAVTAVGVVVLALLTGGAGTRGAWRRSRKALPPAALRAAGLAIGLAAIAIQVVPLVENLQLDRSRADARRGDDAAALRAAAAARDVEPWASSPYLQLALVEEQAGHLPAARAYVDQAIPRDAHDWAVRLIAARIEAKLGAIGAARASLAKARRLNPQWASGAAPGG